MKRALIFGASGQMGSYLCELLRSKHYQVMRPSHKEFNLADMSNWDFKTMLEEELPEEIYNFAGVSYAPDSWFTPDKYLSVNGLAVMRILNIIKEVLPKARYFQAGSAEVFEKPSIMQYEDTNRLPENPYGLSKLLAMETVRIFRQKYGLFACTGILFNAESPRRNKFFFAEKVAQEAVRLKREFDGGKWAPIKLGRLDARRDWGWAPEYAEVAWRILQISEPMDFVIGTGETHTCREFVAEALTAAGLPEVEKNFSSYVQYDKMSSQVGNCMRAMPQRAEKILGWKAQCKFKDVVRMLVEAEMKNESSLGNKSE